MQDVVAVIMAGGVGARFWPLSRRARPKQLLPLGPTEESLLGATVRRVGSLAPPERVLIVTSASLAEETRRAVASVPAGNILAEPVGRNTAPCVGWAALHVARTNPSAVMAVLPADHHIGDENAYRTILARAVDAARDGALVTVGISPSRPETGYGYVEMAEAIAPGVHRVARFVEKPDRAKAEGFLRAGNFLWNSGMFFFRADVVLREIARHLPDLHDALLAIDQAHRDGGETAAVARLYPTLPSISIDYGIMERAESVRVVPGDFGWSDLGSWTTAWELAGKDPNGNAGTDALFVDARNNYVTAPEGKVVTVLGADDLVIVDTPTALLVMPRSRAQDVRQVVDAIEKKHPNLL